MNKNERIKLEKFLNSYFKEIHKIYTSDDFREESFYPALKKLLEECSQLFKINEEANILVLPKKTKVGIPDFRIGKNGEIIGYIEAKTPETNLKEIEDSEQLKRYRNSLPNLMLTNFLEFRLYRGGNLIPASRGDKVEVGRQFTLQNLKYPPIPEKLDLSFEILEKFFSFSTPKIQKSSELSVELAKRTRFLEHILQEELSKNNKEVIRFYKAFQEELIENLTKERFADLYAQTITYGLFAARMRVQNGFSRETAWKFIPESLPLLKEIFYSMTGPHFPESLKWIVDDITQSLAKADISLILKEFKITRWDEDPVIHFYETFLATYNPQERQQLGVYYTPLPVVSYIVKSIHKLLKEKFGKSEGLATRDVTLLDPAAGTLTFVVQAIKQVQKELIEKKKQGLIKPYIEEHILPHFHAFEILVAPYTVGHFKVSMVLEEMGYQFNKGKRFQYYLTNTLEMKQPREISFLLDLTREGQEAQRIKEKVPILVVLGNPPYSVSSENKSDFIENLLGDYKEDVRTERNIQPLSDDYIKFIRFAHWKIEQAGKGIIGFITNNSYLSGVIHRGMRRKLLKTFDEIYILNLHGSSRIGEKTPEGGKDENVFDIQQGVAIALYVKLEKPQKEKMIRYADIWGLRKEKYKYLFGNDVKSTKWQELKPSEPYYFFVPKDFTLEEEYEKFWKVTEIFKEWSSGVNTHRDHFVVGFKKEEIIQRIRIFAGSLPDELVRQSLNLKDSGTWKLSEARQNIKSLKPEDRIYHYAYRPFDYRYICYEPILVERDRRNLMMHVLNKDNLVLTTIRKIPKIEDFSTLICNLIGDRHLISDGTYFFPLYLYAQTKEKKEKSKGTVMMVFEPKAEYKTKEPNFSSEFRKALATLYKKEPSPEEIFYFIYAVLYSHTYRKRYEEFLKIDFPRIPFPSNYALFRKLSNYGNELVELHLLKSPTLNDTDIGFPEGDSNTVKKVFFDANNQRVFINKEQYFEGITREVWEYRIGAYQVMHKYLKDRKKRRLSLDEINHYMKVAKAIWLTIELQKKIDVLYKKIIVK
ncbi:MAG: type ISP restriction/modification enzyme [Candidatus Cloacimonadota bacterium]|nr:type ISP restriction/modification enzyme [Candidatus Cloacimonadota bacterium]